MRDRLAQKAKKEAHMQFACINVCDHYVALTQEFRRPFASKVRSEQRALERHIQ